MTSHRQRTDTVTMSLADHQFASKSYRTVSEANWPKQIDSFCWRWISFNQIHFQHLVFVDNVSMIFYKPAVSANQPEILILPLIVRFAPTTDVTVQPHMAPSQYWLLYRLCLWHFFEFFGNAILIVVITFIHINLHFSRIISAKAWKMEENKFYLSNNYVWIVAAYNFP